MQLGRPEEALRALTTSLDHARAQQLDYDVASAIDAIEGDRRPPGPQERRRTFHADELLERLRVVSLPVPPLERDGKPSRKYADTEATLPATSADRFPRRREPPERAFYEQRDRPAVTQPCRSARAGFPQRRGVLGGRQRRISEERTVIDGLAAAATRDLKPRADLLGAVDERLDLGQLALREVLQARGTAGRCRSRAGRGSRPATGRRAGRRR